MRRPGSAYCSRGSDTAAFHGSGMGSVPPMCRWVPSDRTHARPVNAPSHLAHRRRQNAIVNAPTMARTGSPKYAACSEMSPVNFPVTSKKVPPPAAVRLVGTTKFTKSVAKIVDQKSYVGGDSRVARNDHNRGATTTAVTPYA